MINFPDATYIHRRMPKEAFYKRLSLTTALKDKFISDVDRIYIENSLTKDNLNLTADSEVKEILLLSITLKKQEFDGKVVEAIARQNPHQLVFLLTYEDQRQLAIYHGKLYRTEWMPDEELKLDAHGEERASSSERLSIDQRLALQEKILKLEKQIKKTEAAAWKETQPKKRFDLYQRVQKYKQELEGLKNGES